MAMGKWSGDIHVCPVCRSPTLVMVCWWSWSTIGASVGKEVSMFDVLVIFPVQGLQMASLESV